MSIEVITSVLIAASANAPAGAYDLTDLATVHDELSLPTAAVDNDPFLSRAITQASAVIASYCKRVFAIEALQDLIYIQQDPYPWQTPGGVYPLQLTRWPIINSAVVGFTGNTHGNTTVDGIASTSGITAGALVFAIDGSIPPGTTVASVAGSSITLSESASTSVMGQSLNTGLQVIQTLSTNETQTLVYGTDYTVDPKYGWLIRLDEFTSNSVKWEAEPVQVQYQAGYAPIPSDLQDACLRLVTARYKARGRDPMLVSRDQPDRIGSERYWVGQLVGQNGALPPEIEAMVEIYRVPSVN